MIELANRPMVVLLGAVTVMLGACGAWKPERLEVSTARAIDDRLASQMTPGAFRAEFPDAVLIDGDESNGSWFVHVQRACFWCRSAEGFRRSEDVHARIVRFEDGRIAGIDAVSGSR